MCAGEAAEMSARQSNPKHTRFPVARGVLDTTASDHDPFTDPHWHNISEGLSLHRKCGSSHHPYTKAFLVYDILMLVGSPIKQRRPPYMTTAVDCDVKHQSNSTVMHIIYDPNSTIILIH